MCGFQTDFAIQMQINIGIKGEQIKNTYNVKQVSMQSSVDWEIITYESLFYITESQ